jgi:hypothetical protein
MKIKIESERKEIEKGKEVKHRKKIDDEKEEKKKKKKEK